MPTTGEVERRLPANLDAERAILGAIMLHPLLMASVEGTIDPNDFFRDGHRRIFDAMQRLSARNVPIDLGTLAEELGRKGDLDDSGGLVYLSALIDGVPRATNIESYVKIVIEKAQLRNLIYASNRILAEAYAAESDAADVLAQAEQEIYGLSQRATGAGMLVPGPQLAQEGFSLIERLQTTGQIAGLSTGLSELDTATLGLHPNHLSIVAARPGKAKSAFMLHLGREVGIRQGKVTAVFSLEMGRDELILRMMAAEGRVAGHSMHGGSVGRDGYGRLGEALTRIGESQLFVDDTPGRTIAQIRSLCRRLKSVQGSIALVCIDYLQLMMPVRIAGQQTNREQEVSQMAWGCKMLAKELGAPVVLLSQLGRRADESSSPLLSHLRESGGIEQHADDVLFTNPPDVDNGTCPIIIAKQRNGPKASFLIGYDPSQYRFWNLAHDEIR